MNSEKFNKRMKAIVEREQGPVVNKGYNHDLFCEAIRYESATYGPHPCASFLVTVTQPLCNQQGFLHGGCAATLIDTTSTGLIMGTSKPGIFSLGGVSRSLNVKFLRPVPKGVQIRIVHELVHAGKRFALVKSEIRRVDTGEICVVGENDKINSDPAVEKL
ncbi:hypothetical protein AJ78_00161 [Emergomyces pasteurianus Ep9510]|uniref:Thioesterase domain-containing protein n=1 Tax=Emergomyces pasteurianus Ep9510 TaxID=1447872 RepID=A0A1J9QUT0_9EURO|nr:hypothetical protein AJ78_00161 [Emergomyces pasteurianus Ep9510]